MLKIGAFTFGGGYAMLPLLEHEFVSVRHWLERDEFLDMVAISESTPGPIAVNAATYIGYRVGGFFGAAVATFGVALPSFLTIYLISLFFDRFLELRLVAYAFRGIQVCVEYFILTAGLGMLKGLQKNLLNFCIVSVVMVIMLVCSFLAVRFSTVLLLLGCGGVGIAVYLVRRLSGKEGRNDIS